MLLAIGGSRLLPRIRAAATAGQGARAPRPNVSSVRLLSGNGRLLHPSLHTLAAAAAAAAELTRTFPPRRTGLGRKYRSNLSREQPRSGVLAMVIKFLGRGQPKAMTKIGRPAEPSDGPKSRVFFAQGPSQQMLLSRFSRLAEMITGICISQ